MIFIFTLQNGFIFTLQNGFYLYLKGTVHEKPFFSGKGGLGPSKYESGKKIRIKIKQGARNGNNSFFFKNARAS